MLFCLFRERACAGKYPHSQKEIINELLPLLTYIHTIKTYVHKYMYLFTFIVAKTSFYLHENCRMQRQRQKIQRCLRWVPKGKRPHEVLRKVSQPFSAKNEWIKICVYVVHSNLEWPKNQRWYLKVKVCISTYVYWTQNKL